MKKLLSLLLVLMMVMAVIPASAFAGSERPVTNGYIPTGMHGARLVSKAYERGDMETYYRLTGNKRDTLPSSYDSRNYNYITSVKDQNPYGSCWAHAAMASVESYMIKHNIPVGTGSAATTNLNLSETQHCFFNYTSAYDAEGMLTGDKSTSTQSGSNNGLDCGGNGEMSSYTLQRWTGAASESVSALAYSKASTVASSGLSSTYAYNNNVCHVQNSEWIPATDIEGVKRAIMDYGAGNISYYAGSSYSTYTYTYQCTIDTTSQDSSSHKWANHAITIVGWDDTIAASRFSPNRPSSPGAWLCKNSWGTGYFNNGYMYISYEDTSVLEGYIYFYDAEDIGNYDHNYQYDGSCNVVTFGKGWNSSISTCTGFANNTKVANVFTAKSNELLRAVAYCNWDEGLDYTVEVYKNPTTGNPTSGTLVSSQSGSLTYAGYYTIPLNTPVVLAAGDTFSVVFTQTVSAADANGYYIHTPYDSTFNNTSVVSWANWTHANHGNTSYYKEPNGSLSVCVDNGDFRIKAFTDDYENPYTINAVSNNNAYGTVSVTGTVITATPANGYYVESCDVISGTASCTINGNIINVSASSDCTIRVNFAPKPLYTVNFVASGTAQGSQSALVNDQITLPSSVTVNPAEWTFIGWVDAQIAETTNAPSYYAPGAAYTVTGNTTLYALYTRTESSGGSVIYQLADQLEVGGRYIITSGNYAVKNTVYNTSTNRYLTAQSVTVNSSSNTVTVASSVDPETILWEIESGTDSAGYVFKNTAKGQYMSLSSTEYLIIGTTPVAWLYSGNDLNNQIDSDGYYYLALGSSSTYFTTSKNTNGNIRLYQEISPAVNYYCTDPVIAQPTYYTVTFKDWDGTVLSTQSVEEGTAATAPAVPGRTGYTFTGWDVDFSNVTSDLVVTAQYQINSYTLTINYVDEQGNTIAPTYTGTYAYGASYEVVSPTIEGYTPDYDTVTGIMGAGNVTVTVTYEADPVIVEPLLGDVDCNGEVTMADVTLLAMYLNGENPEISAQGMINANANQDGGVDIRDIAAIYEIISNS